MTNPCGFASAPFHTYLLFLTSSTQIGMAGPVGPDMLSMSVPHEHEHGQGMLWAIILYQPWSKPLKLQAGPVPDPCVVALPLAKLCTDLSNLILEEHCSGAVTTSR